MPGPVDEEQRHRVRFTARPLVDYLEHGLTPCAGGTGGATGPYELAAMRLRIASAHAVVARYWSPILSSVLMVGMPRLVGSVVAVLAWVMVRSRLTSFLAAASRLVCSPWTSPIKPFMRASLMS